MAIRDKNHASTQGLGCFRNLFSSASGRAFWYRTGGFAEYPPDPPLRMLSMTCGGCCGRAVHRKLMNLLKLLRKKEGVGADRVVVHLSSCITKDNFHGPPCPHIDYLKTLIGKLGLAVREDTAISERSEERRRAGVYRE